MVPSANGAAWDARRPAGWTNSPQPRSPPDGVITARTGRSCGSAGTASTSSPSCNSATSTAAGRPGPAPGRTSRRRGPAGDRRRSTATAGTITSVRAARRAESAQPRARRARAGPARRPRARPARCRPPSPGRGRGAARAAGSAPCTATIGERIGQVRAARLGADRHVRRDHRRPLPAYQREARDRPDGGIASCRGPSAGGRRAAGAQIGLGWPTDPSASSAKSGTRHSSANLAQTPGRVSASQQTRRGRRQPRLATASLQEDE